MPSSFPCDEARPEARGGLVARYEYDPYGRIMNQAGFYAGANPFRWSTKRFDPETGLSDFGMRYYSATLGRWLNRDPIGDLGGANVYAYVAGNPHRPPPL
jgi:RHS repeat-associated protein